MPLLDVPFDPKASPLAQAIDQLYNAGYSVIPVLPRDKAPGEFRGSLETGSWGLMNGWNDYANRRPHESMLVRWKTWPDANLGVVLGGDHQGYQLVAIDFDTDIDSELELLSSSIPPSPMRKAGARGWTSFYRAPKTLKTKRYMVAAPTPDKPNGKRTVLEILTGNAPRQTVMPPSMHPHGRPYEYITGNGVVPIKRLPVLTQDHLDVLEDNLGHIGWAGDDIERVDRATRGAAADDDSIWRETNNIALANFDMWVGALGLPKLKRHGNGSWEAVPVFRPSNTGTPTMERKSNLKFHRTGIQDMGVSEGHTAIDVVMAAFSWDFDSAFTWLRAKLGLQDEGDIFLPPEPPAPPQKLEEAEDGSLTDTVTGEIVAAHSSELVELPAHLTHVPGLLGEMTDFAEATAIFPNRALSLASSLTALSTILGRRDATPKRGALSLYTLALAPTGAGKQHGINAAHAFIKAAGAGKHIGTGDYMSQAAFVNRLKKRPLTFSATDEFGIFLQRINERNAGSWNTGLKKVMLTTWGANFAMQMSSGTAGEDGVEIEAPAMSIYGVSTPDMFFKAVQGADTVNGLLNRFLLIATAVRAEEADPERHLDDMPASLVRKLQRAFKVRRPPQLALLGDEPEDDLPDPGGIQLVVPWGVGAKEVYKEFSRSCIGLGDRNADIVPFVARSAEIALRLATIRALGCDIDNPTVSAADMQWGCDVARWSAERMADDAGDLVTDSPYAAITAKLMSKLKQAKGLPVKERDLYKAAGISSQDLQKRLIELQKYGRIISTEINNRGQVSKAWRLVANDNVKPGRKR